MAKKKTAKPKSAAKKATAKKAATKKATTKKAATKKATTKKAATKKAAKKATTKKATAKKATAKKATTKKAAAKKADTKKADTKKAAKKATAKKTSPQEISAVDGVDPAKLSAVLEVILPESSSTRAAASAAASVWAISSEKTQDVRAAIRVRDSLAEDVVREELAEFAEDDAPAELNNRRSTRDPFGFFREELAREELHSDDLLAGWRHQNHRLRHELVRGTPNDEIVEVERQLGFKLPPSYRDFVLEWNGVLYTSPESSYQIIAPTDILPEANDRLGGLMRHPYLPVVDLGCADYLCLDTRQAKRGGEYPIWWWHCGVPERRVAESFLRWLKDLVAAQGEPSWWAAGAH